MTSGPVTAPGGAVARTPDPDRQRAFRAAQRERLERYLRLCDEIGPDAAREELLKGYPEIQRAKMGPLITGVPLIQGFRRAVPLFVAIGVREEVVDVSSDSTEPVTSFGR